MNINIDNNKGQQKVVTRKRLQEYVNWLNQTNGGSYLRVTSGMNLNAMTITISSMLADANGGITTGNTSGIGTVHWVRSDTGSTPASTAATGSITITGTSRTSFPMGKFWLENGDDKDDKYTVLDNTPVGIPNLNFSGYTQMTFNETAGNTDPDYCVTYNDLIESTYTRYFNSATMTDGLIVNSYSIDDGKVVYDGNQLVAEKDVNYGKLSYNLEISHITLEIDAMTDLEEYRSGYIPYTDREIKFAEVNDVKYDSDGRLISKEAVNDFVFSKAISDNDTTKTETYSGLTLSKSNSVAKAAISGNNYQVTVYYYSDEFTLTSTTITTPIGTAKNTSISGSTALGTTGAQRRINVSISTTGALTFDIKQRPEIYGYFPVDVYKNNIDENGNVQLSARTSFISSTTYTTSITSYSQVVSASTGWLDNAGDNFGANALSVNKVKLNSDDSSVYDSVLAAQGVTDDNICGQDVYNTNSTVYDRGVSLGTYHMAYANDAYGNMNYTGGLRGTQHLFITSGYTTANEPAGKCCANKEVYTSDYQRVTCFEYTYDRFISELVYQVWYDRMYYKDCHAYGRTSMLRRFRKIGSEYKDTAINSFPTEVTQKVSGIVSGSSFPRHIQGKTIECRIRYGWNEIGEIKSGDNNVSGWTTVFENEIDASNENFPSTESIPTTRGITVISGYSGDDENEYRVYCEPNSSSDYAYYNIAPKFYMVDAETCNGLTSGYTFRTTKTIVDTTNGRSTTRNYQVEENKFLASLTSTRYATKYGSIQKSNKPMLVYNNVDVNDNVKTLSSRFGSYRRYVTCTFSAPTQKVYWVDSYAPNSKSGGIMLENKNLAFINASKNYVGSGSTPELTTYSVIPGTSNWSSFGYQLPLTKINDFDNTSNYTFPGETKYNGSSNNSSHSLIDSFSFANNNVMVYSKNTGDQGHYDEKLGYDVVDSSIFGNGSTPLHAVSSVTEFNGTTYTGSNYVYFDGKGRMSGATTSLTNVNKYTYLPLKSKYTDDVALRPCNGDVTIPYWNVNINFIAKPKSGLTFANDTVSEFGLKFYVDGTEMTTSGTVKNGITYKLITNNNTNVVYSDFTFSGDSGTYSTATSKPGYYLRFNDSLPITVDGQNLRHCSVTLLVVDAYGGNNGDFEVAVSSSVYSDQRLSWLVNGKRSNSVGAKVLAETGLKKWGNYEENGKGQGEFACIGILGQNSVADMMYHKQKTFGTFVNNSPQNSVNVSPTESHEGLYW